MVDENIEMLQEINDDIEEDESDKNDNVDGVIAHARS
jgi:hypothetical protein